jgi:hypothetical protein
MKAEKKISHRLIIQYTICVWNKQRVFVVNIKEKQDQKLKWGAYKKADSHSLSIDWISKQ